MLLFDQNLSYKLVPLLQNVFPGCEHVRHIDLTSAPDVDIWTFAIKNNLAIATQDFDFMNISAIKNHPPKVIHIAIGNASTSQIFDLISKNTDSIKSFLNDPALSYLVLN